MGVALTESLRPLETDPALIEIDRARPDARDAPPTEGILPDEAPNERFLAGGKEPAPIEDLCPDKPDKCEPAPLEVLRATKGEPAPIDNLRPPSPNGIKGFPSSSSLTTGEGVLRIEFALTAGNGVIVSLSSDVVDCIEFRISSDFRGAGSSDFGDG